MEKSRISVLLLALLASCSVNIEPAVTSAGQLRSLFLAEQENTRKLVESSNPPPVVLEAFLGAQAQTRTAFTQVFDAHVGYIASIGAVKPEQVNAILDKVIAIKEAGK